MSDTLSTRSAAGRANWLRRVQLYGPTGKKPIEHEWHGGMFCRRCGRYRLGGRSLPQCDGVKTAKKTVPDGQVRT